MKNIKSFTRLVNSLRSGLDSLMRLWRSRAYNQAWFLPINVRVMASPLTPARRQKSARIQNFANAHSLGFTLAETLITLTILGLVAAIMVPSIVKHNQKLMTITRLKMAYSMLDNMTQQSLIENGYPPVRTGGSLDISTFDKYFRPYLNIMKDCGITNDHRTTKARGCFKTVNGEDVFYYLNGGSQTQAGYKLKDHYTVILKNGISLGILCNNCYYNGFTLTVDIDGPNKGDSKLGQDVFMFRYISPLVVSNGGCQHTGLLISDFVPNSACTETRGNLKNKCKIGANGVTCSGLIIKDGWKISDDYPWNYAHEKP